VHEIDTHHMVAYAQYLATRTGRHKNNKGEKKLLSVRADPNLSPVAQFSVGVNRLGISAAC
jgi:hypothetical protein